MAPSPFTVCLLLGTAYAGTGAPLPDTAKFPDYQSTSTPSGQSDAQLLAYDTTKVVPYGGYACSRNKLYFAFPQT